MSYLICDSLSVRFGNVLLLRDVNLEVAPGGVTGITGRNGAGKSTLLRVMAGQIEPTTGKIHRNVTTSLFLELNWGLIPRARVEEYIEAMLLADGRQMGELDRSKQLCVEYLGAEVMDKSVLSLSSGMLARVNLATALSLEQGVIIIDEWLSTVDLTFVRGILADVRENSRQAVVLASHDETWVREMSDITYEL